MPLQRPQLFGFEGIVFWDTVLFPVDHAAGKYEPTAQEIVDWFLAATKSDDPRSVSIASVSETFDITPRPIALRGWRHTKRLPNTISLTIELDHATGSNAMVHDLITAWQTNSQIALAALDQDAGVGEYGIVGNFHVSMTKREPLRAMQSWSVLCEPESYIDWYES